MWGFSPGAENNETSIKKSISHKVGNFKNNIFSCSCFMPRRHIRIRYQQIYFLHRKKKKPSSISCLNKFGICSQVTSTHQSPYVSLLQKVLAGECSLWSPQLVSPMITTLYPNILPLAASCSPSSEQLFMDGSSP